MPTSTIMKDGFQVIDQGMDSGNAPENIGNRKLSWAVNCSMRGGYPHSRPSWVKRTLTFSNVEDKTNITTGLFQGAGSYLSPHTNTYLIVIVIAGRVFTIDPNNNFLVRDISIAGDLNFATTRKAWMTQAEDFLIVQDGISKPLIFNGASSFRPMIDKQVPTMKAMSYVNGRLWGAIPSENGFIGSDLTGSSSGSAPYNFRDAVLWFTQNTFLIGGGQFSTPTTAGPIRALTSFGQIDTSLGQGPLQVFTTLGGFSCNAPPDRTTWQNLQFPIQTVSMVGIGAVSQESCATINGDVWFRSGDGAIHSFQIARRDIGSWANTPMSFEMTRVLATDDLNFLDHASGANFDNRLLMLTGPQFLFDRGVYWQGMVSLDFSNISGLGQNLQPAWDGLWTGLNIMQIVPCGTSCFLWTLNLKTNVFELWEIDREDQESWFGYDKDGTVPIQSRIESMSLDFRMGGFTLIQIDDGTIWVDSLEQTTAFNVSWKRDNFPGWTPWTSFSENSKSGMCPTICPPTKPFQPQMRPYLEFGTPPETCDPEPQRPSRLMSLGYQFQVALDISGAFELKRLMLVGHVENELPEPCRGTSPLDTSGVSLCSNPFSYDSTNGI